MTYASPLIGRTGNKFFQYCHLRAVAERDGVPFVTPAWEGDEIFDLPKHEQDGDLTTFGGYRQEQSSIIYTRAQVREWFKLRPEIAGRLAHVNGARVVAHHRAGDYLDLGYPVVSRESYREACANAGHDPAFLMFVSEQHPVTVDGLPDWLPDFYRIMSAKVLFRGNSSFSWWAAALSDAEVYSPVVEGLGAGVHYNVPFVAGNYPRFCSLPFVTDLHLQ